MFLEETTDGNVYQLQFVRRGSVRFWYYVGVLTGLISAAVFFSLAIAVFSLDNGTAVFMGVIGAIILLAVIIIRQMGIEPVYIIDPVSKQISSGDSVYNITADTRILLNRLFSVTYSSRRSSSGTRTRTRVEKVIWSILLVDSQQELEIYYHKGSSFATNCPWIDKLAETIAELTGIPLEDNTGVEPIIRMPGKTDTPIIDILKDEFAESGISVDIPVELEKRLIVNKYEEPSTSFEIYSIYNPVTAIDYILFIISAALICIGILGNIWLIQLFSPLISDFLADTSIDKLFGMILSVGVAILMLNIFTLVLGYWLFTTIAGMNIIVIDHQNVTVKHKGMILSRIKGKIPLNSIERLPLVKTFRAFTIEFMSDAGRILVPGNYEEGEADLLRELLKHILYQF